MRPPSVRLLTFHNVSAKRQQTLFQPVGESGVHHRLRSPLPAQQLAIFNPLPEPLMEIIGNGIYRRFHQGHSAPEQPATCHGIDDAKGDGEMHDCEGNGFSHGTPLKE